MTNKNMTYRMAIIQTFRKIREELDLTISEQLFLDYVEKRVYNEIKELEE